MPHSPHPCLQAPPKSESERAKLQVKVDKSSQRLQMLEPFKPWHGDDIKDAAILIKVGPVPRQRCSWRAGV
jgi:hypothetical protein